jgi:hypothetical protein
MACFHPVILSEAKNLSRPKRQPTSCHGKDAAWYHTHTV